MITLTQMEYALAVEKYRHFARAAESRNVTQPTLSMQLAKLENDLGVVLFDRSKSPILVTPKGEKVLAHMKKVLQEVRGVLRASQEEDGDLAGDFNLGIIPTLSPYLIPYFLKTFREQYPKVNLHLYELETKNIIELLENDELDGGLLVTPLKRDTLIERHLFFEEMFVYIHPQHPLSSYETIPQEKLQLSDLWTLKEGHCFRTQSLQICQKLTEQNSEKNKRQTLFESGSLETLIYLVESSGGHTLLPWLSAQKIKERKSKSMALIKSFKGTKPHREISLVHARPFYKEKIIMALEEIILKKIPNSLRSLKKDSRIIAPQ